MLLRFFASYYLMAGVLVALAVLAAVATFVENDFGTSTARAFFYEAWWFGVLLLLACINILVVIIRTKMWKKLPRAMFHGAFFFILAGALLTHFLGVEGTLELKENDPKNSFLGTIPHLHIKLILDEDPIIEDTFSYRVNAWKNSLLHTLFLDEQKIDLKILKANVEKDGLFTKADLELEVSYKEEKAKVNLSESSYELPTFSYVEIGGAKIGLGYGPISHKLPFLVDLKRFDIVYYPGGYAPATYSSIISVDNKEHLVGMNAPFRTKGYAFYQSSYTKDSTTLWVNKDPGKWPTYFGYALLFLGLILNLFDKKSRLRLLAKRVKKLEAALGVILICSIVPSYANEYEKTYLNDLRTKSLSLADSWGSLVVQTKAGRMKPLDTLSREILLKISGKDTYEGLSANQVLLGMFTHQSLWKRMPLIKVKTPKLKETIGLKKEERLAKFEDFFTENSYKLEKLVGEASKISLSKRSTFDKDLIAVDERLNVALMSFYGAFFKIVPDSLDPSNPWKSVDTVYKTPSNEKEEEIARHIVRFMDRAFARDFEAAIEPIKAIDSHAKTYGEEHYLEPKKLKMEIVLNKLSIFPMLINWYIVLGFTSLVLGFVQVLRDITLFSWTRRVVFWVLSLAFLAHTFGILGRWYIAGFIPMSNTYESIIYIAWSAALAGLILFRRSFFGLGAALSLAGIFMFVAHLGSIDPQITPLMPVLDSFWLSVHVSVITASYGFLGVGALLGLVVLVLYALAKIFKVKDEQITYLTYVNEIALIVGLSLLVIGNFIGGIWANESWGRYWGWDPKETWTFVAIVVYVLVVHLRFLPKVYSPLNFALASFLGYGTILMTYFGVNFYLAGLHSYASGDPVPIPSWIYIVILSIVFIYVFAWRNRNQIKRKSNEV